MPANAARPDHVQTRGRLAEFYWLPHHAPCGGTWAGPKGPKGFVTCGQLLPGGHWSRSSAGLVELGSADGEAAQTSSVGWLFMAVPLRQRAVLTPTGR